MSIYKRQAASPHVPLCKSPLYSAPRNPNSEFKSPHTLVKDHQHCLSFFCQLFQLINQINIDQAPIYLSRQLSSEQNCPSCSRFLQLCDPLFCFSFYFHQPLVQKLSILPKADIYIQYNITCFYSAVAESRCDYHMPYNRRSQC